MKQTHTKTTIIDAFREIIKITALIANNKCIVHESNFISTPLKNIHTLEKMKERRRRRRRYKRKKSDEPTRSDITRDQSI